MKKCSKCSKEFECGASVGKCWCMDFYIDPEVLNKLKEDFKDCLCPNCLNEYTSNDIDDFYPNDVNCVEVENGIYTYTCDDCGRKYNSMHDGEFQGIALCKNCTSGKS